MSTGVSLVCADGYSPATSYQCFCDFRIQIIGCGDSSVPDLNQMWKNLFILVELVNYLVGIFALALLAWRVLKKNKRLWWQKNMSDAIGLLRPRPVEMFLLLIGIFGILRGLDTSLVGMNSFPNYHSREFMFEIAWQFGLWAVLCYFIGTIYEISLHCTLSTPSLASYIIPSPFLLDLYALLLLVTPLITLNVFASLTGIFSDEGNSKVAMFYRRIHYGFWSFYLATLGLGMVWFAIKLGKIRRAQERFDSSNIYDGANWASRKFSLGTATAISEKEEQREKKINLTYKSLATLALFLSVLMLIYTIHRDQIHTSHSLNVFFGLLWILIPAVCFGAIVMSLIIKEMNGTDDDSHLNNLLPILSFPSPPFVINSRNSSIHSDSLRTFSEFSGGSQVTIPQKAVIESQQTTTASREINYDRKVTNSAVSVLTTSLYGALSTEFQTLFGIGNNTLSSATASGSKAVVSNVPETLTSPARKFLNGRRLEGWDYAHSSATFDSQTTPNRISASSGHYKGEYYNNEVEQILKTPPSLAYVESIGSLNGVPVQKMFGFGNGTIPKKSQKGKERRISSKYDFAFSQPQSVASLYYQYKPNSPPISPSLTMTSITSTVSPPQKRRSGIDNISTNRFNSLTTTTTASPPLTLETAKLLQIPKISGSATLTPSFGNPPMKPTRSSIDGAQMGAQIGASTLLLNIIGNLQQSGNDGAPPKRFSVNDLGEDTNPEVLNIARFSGIGQAVFEQEKEQRRTEGFAEFVKNLKQDNEAVLENNELMLIQTSPAATTSAAPSDYDSTGSFSTEQAMDATITTLSQPPQLHSLHYGRPSIVDAKNLSRSNSNRSLSKKNDTNSNYNSTTQRRFSDNEGDGNNRKGNRTSTLHDIGEYDLESVPAEQIVEDSPVPSPGVSSDKGNLTIIPQIRLRSLVRKLWAEDDNASSIEETGERNVKRESNKISTYRESDASTYCENDNDANSQLDNIEGEEYDQQQQHESHRDYLQYEEKQGEGPINQEQQQQRQLRNIPMTTNEDTTVISSRSSSLNDFVFQDTSSTFSTTPSLVDRATSPGHASPSPTSSFTISSSAYLTATTAAHSPRSSVSTSITDPRKSVASSTNARNSTEFDEDYEYHKNSINNNDLMIMQLFFGSYND